MIAYLFAHPTLIVAAYLLLIVGLVYVCRKLLFSRPEPSVQSEIDELDETWNFPPKWKPSVERYAGPRDRERLP